jgi:hypothetical protein
MLNAQEIFSQTVRALSPKERLRLASLILDDLTETGAVVDASDAWSEEDMRKLSRLAEAFGGDESVRSEVEALIAAHEQSGEFLDSPAYEIASGTLAKGSRRQAVGEILGYDKILGTLGTAEYDSKPALIN